MTYYQTMKLVSQLKRIKSHIKHREYPHYPEPVIYSALMSIDELINRILTDPLTHGRTRVWREHEKVQRSKRGTA